MTNSTDQQLLATFQDAVRRPHRPDPTPGPEHGPMAGRRPDRSLFLLALDRIRPDEDQVRTRNKSVTDEEVRELSESIKAVGLENPLTVRYDREADIYELIAGERRYTASKLAGLTEVPVKVIEADEPMIRRLQLHENIHRANLTPLEVADALSILLVDGETQETLATMLCKSVAYVQKAITIAQRLSAPAKALVESNVSRFTSLDLLYDVAQTPADQQKSLLLRIKDERLTRDELREITAPLKDLAKASRGTSRGRKAQERRYSRVIAVEEATITVAFGKPHVSKLEIIRALKQAIQAVHATPEPSAPSQE